MGRGGATWAARCALCFLSDVALCAQGVTCAGDDVAFCAQGVMLHSVRRGEAGPAGPFLRLRLRLGLLLLPKPSTAPQPDPLRCCAHSPLDARALRVRARDALAPVRSRCAAGKGPGGRGHSWRVTVSAERVLRLSESARWCRGVTTRHDDEGWRVALSASQSRRRCSHVP